MEFDTARWIWLEGMRQYNSFVCFRREVTVNSRTSDAKLRLTADSRYELFVNGKWIGHGPPRSFPAVWPVDEYDLQSILNPGLNILAILVTHYGTGNFQYIHAPAGLIADLTWADSAGVHSISTDSSWRACIHGSFGWPVPRISLQQGWEEQYDARHSPSSSGPEWVEVAYDDSKWDPANILEKAPHTQLEMRDIPMLAHEAVAPMRLVGVDAVRPPSQSWSINVRHPFNEHDFSTNSARVSMFLATHINSPVKQKIQIHDLPGYFPRQWKLNGKLLKFDDRSLQRTDAMVAHGMLNAGINQLVFRFAETTQELFMHMNFWTDQPVQLVGDPTKGDAPWLMVGPFKPSKESRSNAESAASPPDPYEIHAAKIPSQAHHTRFTSIWDRGYLVKEDLSAPFSHIVPADCISPVDVFAITTGDRAVAGISPKVDSPNVFLFDNSDWTSIHPVEGADVRLLIDFGRELVAHHEFDIDAPSGTIVDVHSFEFIQRDGRYNLAEGVNNTFRYICREGRQTYRTFGRRGFQYTWVTLRDFSRPVRIRNIRALFSTYPQVNAGGFASSDPLLDRIWQVGAHSVRCCSEDTYTDCPSYEQTHWVGDARNEALVDLVVNGDPRLSRHCWIQTGRSLDRSPITESHVPSAWQNILPAWTFLWMRWAEEHYRMTGDRAFVAEAMPYLDRNFQGIEKHVNSQDLFDIQAWNMFDWAPMDTPPKGVVTHQNCLAVLGLRQTAKLAVTTGERKRANAWNSLANRLTAAINKHLWDAKMNAYLDCVRPNGERSRIFSQQTQTAAYISGVASGKRGTRCRSIIAHPPKGFVTAGSPFFMFFVLEGMVREGRWREMIEGIRTYWGIQINLGATAFWEMYYSNRERKARSHCHGWSAAPVFFLSYYVLGIQPAEPGFKKVRIAPRPGDLTWAHGRMPTPHGVIESRFEKSAKEFFLEVRLPAPLPVEIELPRSGNLRIETGKANRITSSRGSVTIFSQSTHLRVHIS